METKKIGSVVTALAIAAGTFAGVAFTATPASAACYGGGCDGIRPENSGGCNNDAVTAYSTVDGVKKYAKFKYYNATVELRYSPSCYAFWARVTIDTQGWAGDYLESTGYDNGKRVDGGWNEQVHISGLNSAGNQAWTPMWGRRSASRYSWGAKIRREGSGAKEIRWPVTGVISS